MQLVWDKSPRVLQQLFLGPLAVGIQLTTKTSQTGHFGVLFFREFGFLLKAKSVTVDIQILAVFLGSLPDFL